MMERHKRWFCDACAREWVHAHRWTPEQGCPACGAGAVRQVEYEAVRGLDMPRGVDVSATLSLVFDEGAPAHVIPPPTALVAVAPAPSIAYDGGYL